MAIVDALRRVLLAEWRRTRPESDAIWDDDDWPFDLMEDGTRIDTEAAANMAYWARRRATDAADGVPDLAAQAVQAQAERLGGRVSRRAMRDLERAGASRRALAERLQIRPDQVVAAHMSAVEYVEATAWARETLARVTGDARESAIAQAAWMTGEIEKGATWRRIAKGLRERVGVVENRATLIARDQVGKLQHRMTRAAHRAAGVEGYRWIEVGDDAVRDEHRAAADRSRRGHVYTWGAPEVEGVMGDLVEPGEDIQCRCTAYPVIPEDLRR